MYLKLFLYLPFIASIFLGGAWASDLSFSARLVNSDGSPVAGPVDLKFELAYSNDNSNILCTKILTDVGLSSGVFHANLVFTSDDCLNNKKLVEVLQETPLNESLMMRVVDETDSGNPKTYPFQALNTVPMSVMSEVSQTLIQMGAEEGEVLKWVSGEWVPASDDGKEGTVISITAGDGLDGGTITETGTIKVKSEGIAVGMLAPDSVISAKIKDETIENVDIKDGQITYAKLNLQDNDIQASKVADLKGAAFVDVGMDSGMAMQPDDVPNCAADEKLQMSALPVYPRSWSCVGESTGMDDTKLPLAGGTMSGGIDMGGNEVTNLLAPSLATDATTKQYVDDGLADKANTTDLDSYVARAGDNMTGALKLDAQSELRLADSDSNEYIGLRSHANVVGNYVLTFPADTGATDQVLSTDGSGNLSWTTPSTTATPEGSAGGELAGTYPNPDVADGVIDNANVAAGANVDAVKLGTGAVDNTEFNTLNGVTSSIQTQLDSKQDDIGSPSDSTQYLNGAGTWQTLNTSVVPESGNLYYDLTRAQGDLIGDAVADGVLNVAPSQNAVFDQLATKADTTDLDSYVLRAGDSMSGNLDMGTNTVTNLATPSATSDAATKQYVDDGLSSKAESTDLNDYVAVAGDNMSGTLQLDAQNELRLADTGSTNYVALRSSASVTTYTLTLPDSVGTLDQVLSTDGSGNLSWSTPSTTATPEGSAGGELAGTYPNPTIEDGVIDNANIATGANIDAAKLGTGVVDNTEFDTLNGVTSSIQTQLDAKEGTITAGATTEYWSGDKTWQTLDTDAVAEATNQYFTGGRARTAVVDDAIVDATTDRAPSQNAVFDALADKANSTDLDSYVLKAGDTMGGTLNLPVDGLVVGTNQLVATDGNVGIGTSTPGAAFNIATPTSPSGGSENLRQTNGWSNSDLVDITGATGSVLLDHIVSATYTATSPTTIDKAVTFKIDGAPDVSDADLTTGDPLAFWVQSDNASFGGNVGIGTTTPSELLVVGDDIGNLTASSNALVVGDNSDPARFYLSEDANNFASIFWDNTNDLLAFDTKETGTYYPSTLAVKSGQVGIGTTDPTAHLTVFDTSDAAITVTGDSDLDTASLNLFELGEVGNEHGFQIQYDGDTGKNLLNFNAYEAGGPTTAVSIQRTNGYVGVGRTNPSNRLHVSGNIGATGWIGAGCEGACSSDAFVLNYNDGRIRTSDGTSSCSKSGGSATFSCSSDRRLKYDIKDFSDGLDAIIKLRPRTFYWKDDESSQINFGFIAQEVQKVIPHAVTKNKVGEEDYLSLDQGAFTPYVINALQDLNEKIERNKKMYNFMSAKEKKVTENSREIASLKDDLEQVRDENKKIKDQNKMLIDYICSKDPAAHFCH